MKQFYVVPINGDVFSLTTSALNVGCMYFVTYISTDISGQWVQGSADLKKGDEVGEQHHARRGGSIRGLPNTARKIGKYQNTMSKIDKMPIPHFFSVTLTKGVSISRFCSSQAFMHQQSTSAIMRKREMTSNSVGSTIEKDTLPISS